MKESTSKKVIFFGCPLDADERDESIQEKHLLKGQKESIDDPYEVIMQLIRTEIDPNLWEEKGSIDVPGWLRPMPYADQLDYVNVESLVRFIDNDGCRKYSKTVGDFIASQIFPHVPCMVGVDHSLTGGAFQRLTEFYKPADISLIVLDSHLDAIPVSILSGAVHYDIENNPNSVHDKNDPYICNRSESYNASSFLYYLVGEGVVAFNDLYVIGISDYPTKRAFRIKDERIRRYVGVYRELEERGVNILTNKEILSRPSKVGSVFGKIKTPYVYISIDMDVGARNAVDGVRFRDRQGLSIKQIFRIIDYLHDLLSCGIELVGMDIMEINPRRANAGIGSGNEDTYRMASNLVKRFCFSGNMCTDNSVA